MIDIPKESLQLFNFLKKKFFKSNKFITLQHKKKEKIKWKKK